MKFDIIYHIRLAESGGYDNYHAIGSVVNTKYNGENRGIALGVWQALPDTIAKLKGGWKKLESENKQLYSLLIAAKKAQDAKRFKAMYEKTLTKIYTPAMQDELQKLYMLNILKGYPDDRLIDYRDLIMANHNGRLMGVEWWLNFKNLYKDLTRTNDGIYKSAYSYLRDAGINPLRVGYVTAGEARDYFGSYQKGKILEVNIGESLAPTNYDLDAASDKYGSLLGYEYETRELLPTSNTTAGGFTVIGDIELYIPPSAIRIYQQNQIYTADALRMSGNAKLINNAPVTRIDLTVYFNGKDAINKQLRPLIAQFRQTPFTILRNETAYYAFLDILQREELLSEEDLQDVDPFQPIPVVLDSISLNTVPGFPDLVQAHITLDIFNHLPFVPKMRFWRKSRDAMMDTIYSVYRNSTDIHLEDISPNENIIITDRYGNVRAIPRPNSHSPLTTTVDPTRSYAYRKTYSVLLEEAEPFSESYPSSQKNKMTQYTGDNSLHLKYYSIGGVSLHKQRLEEMLRRMTGTLSSLFGVVDLAALEGDRYLNREVNINIFGRSLASIIQTVNDMYYLYADLRAATIQMGKLYLQLDEIGPIVNEAVYVTDPYDPTAITQLQVSEVIQKLYKMYEDKPDKRKLLSKVISDIALKMVLHIKKEFPSIKDTENLKPTSLILSWKEDDFNELKEEEKTTQAFYFPQHITGISLSYRNKLAPVPVHGYELSTYQHLGSGEFSITINLKTPDESFIRYLEDIQTSTGTIMRDQLTKKRGFKHVTHRVEITNSGNLLRALGINHVTFQGMEVRSIDGFPGWYDITLEMVQDDLSLEEFNKLKLVETLRTSVIEKLADDLFPFSKSLKYEFYRELLSQYEGTITSTGIDHDGKEYFTYSELVKKHIRADTYRLVPEPEVFQYMFRGPTIDPDNLPFYVPNLDYSKVKLDDPDLLPVKIEFYSKGKLQTELSDFINRRLINRVSKIYLALYILAAYLKPDSSGLYDLKGIYDRYISLLADYFIVWSQHSAAFHINQMKHLDQPIYSQGTEPEDEMLMSNALIKQKRFSLARWMLLKDIFRNIVVYGSDKAVNFPASFIEGVNELDRVMTKANEAILDNYPDFAFPFLETDRDHYRLLGPGFPYVDYYDDNIFLEEYNLGENFASVASYLMTALTGKMSLERFKGEQTQIKSFLSQLKNEAQKSKLFDADRIPSWEEIEKDLQVFEELLQPEKQKEKAEELFSDLSRTRDDVLRLLRTQAILRWYTVSRILNPSGNGFVVDITFPENDKDGELQPADVKIHIRVPGTNNLKVESLEKLLAQLVFKEPGSTTTDTHLESVRKALESGGSINTEELLGMIYQTKMDMINLLNVRDPEAYTSFLGFTDADAAAKRRELHKRLIEAKSKTFQDSMYRAFPTIKIFFLDEDNNEWMLFDDFYNYNALISCDIVESKHAASSTAIIRLSNLTGKLSGGEWQSELIDLDTPYRLDNLMLRVGVPIMIKAGYGPDHRNLRMLFYGAVTELRPGEIIEITAQSWGAELTNPVSTSSEGMCFSFTSAERSMGSAILKILSSTPGLKHFGRWSPALLDADPHRISTVDAERAWWISQMPIADFLGGWMVSGALGETGDKLRAYARDVAILAKNYRSGLVNWGNPLYDNIYLAATQEVDNIGLQIATFDLVNIFSTEGQFQWKIYNQNVWDALWEMALFQGDYIVRPLPYNENSLIKSVPPRLTLYFGPRNGYYKFADNQNFAPPKQLKMSTDMVKAFLKDHEQSSTRGRWPIKSLKALQEFIIEQVNHLDKTADQLFLPSWLDVIFNWRSRKIQKLVRIIYQLREQGLERIGNQLLRILELQPAAPVLYGYFAINDTQDLITLLKDPRGFVRNRFGKRLELDRIDSYQSYEEFTEALIRAYSPALLWPEWVGAIIELAYNWYQWLLEDISTIVYDFSTANYQEGLYDVPTIRKWMEEGPQADLFRNIFEFARNAGLDNRHLYKPIVEYHFVNSYQHIIDNQIVASADNMFNKVEVLFPKKPTIYPPNLVSEESGNKLYRVTAQLNPYLDPNYIRTYQTFQKNLRFNWLVDWLSGKKYGITEKDGKLYTARTGMPLFRNVANQILMNVAKPMYQGTLTITGNPNIKPWHVVFLYDAVNQMWGPFEVEQVVHSFNPQTGFTTTITPNAYMTHRSLQEVWDTQYLSTFGAIESAEIWYRGILGGLATTITTSLIKTVADPIKSFVSKTFSSLSGTVGTVSRLAPWAVAGYMIAKTALRLKEIQYVGAIARASLLGGWNPITIVPLMYQGKPYLAGVEGAYWGDNVYTFILGQLEENPEYIIQMYPSIIDPKKDLMK